MGWLRRLFGAGILFWGFLQEAPVLRFLDWVGRFTAGRDVVDFLRERAVMPASPFAHSISLALLAVGILLLMPEPWLAKISRVKKVIPLILMIVSGAVFVASGVWYFWAQPHHEGSDPSPEPNHSLPTAAATGQHSEKPHVVSTEQAELLSELDKFICKKDEIDLRDTFDFPDMFKFNVRFFARDFRKDANSPIPPMTKVESDEIDKYFENGKAILNLHYIGVRKLPSGSIEPLPIPGKIGTLNTSRKHEMALKTVMEFAESSVMPSAVKGKLNSFVSLVEDDRAMILDVFNIYYPNDVMVFLDNEVQSSPRYGEISNKYWDRFKSLRKGADELRQSIRDFLNVE